MTSHRTKFYSNKNSALIVMLSKYNFTWKFRNIRKILYINVNFSNTVKENYLSEKINERFKCSFALSYDMWIVLRKDRGDWIEFCHRF